MKIIYDFLSYYNLRSFSSSFQIFDSICYSLIINPCIHFCDEPNIEGKGIFSQDFASATGIKPYSTLQTSVSLLIKKGILAESNDIYEITGVFFKEWIRLMTG